MYITHKRTYDTLAPIRDALDMAEELPQNDVNKYKKEQQQNLKITPLKPR